jgi:hypothetical protein
MAKIEEKKLVAGSIIIIGLIFSVVAACTDCLAGGADNYAHFNIARWAFRYPYLFLDHWGKPLFTILIAPFTQIGFLGARLFNITAGLLAAWICYLLAANWKYPKAWLTPVFVVFAPMFFILLFTGMTEILFSLVLILAILMFFRNRFMLSAIIISFIILVRSEGIIFLPIFFAAFLFKRSYSAIPFLLSGFLFFSLIGQLYFYHDFWWLIHKMPYGIGSREIYGTGKWYHFIQKMPDYLGFGVLLLFLFGTLLMVQEWIKAKFRFNSENFYQLLILGGCFFGYLASHSYLWWRGDTSVGLLRVMAGVSPIAGILALVGYNKIENLIPAAKMKILLMSLVILLIVIPGSLKYKSEFKGDPHSPVIEKAIDWLRQTNNFQHHLIVHDPSIAFLAEVDAWDQQIIQYGFSDINKPETALPDSSIFIWDAHFSQNEGRIPASSILENPYFELIAYFEPDVPFQVLGGYNYCIMVFRKVSARSFDNNEVLNQMKAKLRAGEGTVLFHEFIDFQKPNPETINEKFRIASNDSITNYYFLLNSEHDSGPCVQLSDNQLEISNSLSFEVEFDVLAEEKIEKNELVMVFSVEKDNKSYYYQGDDVSTFLLKSNQWNHALYHFTMPEEIKKNSQIKFYIWDVAKKQVRIDNFKIQAFSKKKV